MRFLASGETFLESLQIGAELRSLPPTFLWPLIEDDTRLQMEPVRMLGCGPMVLLLAESTASWCLVDEFEAAVASGARGQTFAAVCSEWPTVPEERLREFFSFGSISAASYASTGSPDSTLGSWTTALCSGTRISSRSS